MPACAVAVCGNRHFKTRNSVSYHVFPKDRKLAKLWVFKCRRKDNFNINHARVCSEHFLPTDYEDDMKNRLLGLKQKRKLKPDAVPSVKLSTCEDSNEGTSSRTERTRNRNVRQRALDRLKCLSPKRNDDTSMLECDSRTDSQLHGSGTVPKVEKDHIPLEPTVEIKEEPLDYHPGPSTSNAPPANEEFILPHEDNSWASPDAVVEPQFTLSVASLAEPETSDGEQMKKKRRIIDPKTTTHVPSTNGPTSSSQSSPVYNFGEFSNPGSSKEQRKDHFDVFGEYIAAKLRNLDRVSCAFVQKAIGDIIFEAEMGKYLNQTQNSKS